jgi:hypothetical protein
VAKVRSPVLGFNHNVKHLHWVFHVQTEDSGVHNPHLFTHLFHGGVIISSKKVVYDPNAEPDVVKGLMQAQHKAMLKELKSGTHDDKITRYLKDVPWDDDTPAARSGAAGHAPGFSAVGHRPAAEPGAPVTAPTAPTVPAAPVASMEPLLDLEAATPIPDVATTMPMALPPDMPPPSSEAVGPRAPRMPVPSEPTHVEFRAPRAKPEVASDVSAAFRAMSSATRESARIPTQLAQAAAHGAGLAQSRPVPTLRPPAVPGGQGQDEPLDLEVGPLPTPPPGAGVWSGRPQITQERPFDRSGAVKVPADMPPPRGLTSTMGSASSTAVPSFRPAVERTARNSTPPAPPRPPTMPPPVPQGARPVPRPTPAIVSPALPPTASPTPSGGVPRPVPPSPSGQLRRATPVVVSRPAMIVGAPPQTTAAARRVRDSVSGETFGKDLISERSLDEVIMAYLSEDAGEE